MTHHNFYLSKQQQKQSGIALLMTILVLGVVLAVTLSIVELSLQHLALSVDSKESEIAFHAANAGLECARYMRRHATSTFETGKPVTFTCFGASPSVSNIGTAGLTISSQSVNDKLYRYTIDIDWGPAKNRCSSIDMVVMMASTTPTGGSGITITSPSGKLASIFPSYPTASKTCAPGAMCTLVSVSGYDAACLNKNVDGVLKRQVLLEF